jgi:hypothetical protein
VLERRLRVCGVVGDPPAGGREDQEVAKYSAATDRGARLVALSALLAIDRAEYIAPEAVWVTAIVPGALGGGFSSRSRRTAPAMSFQFPSPLARFGGDPLTDVEQGALVQWAGMVEEHYDPVIDVATRRVMAAIIERSDPQDALIDAVIALRTSLGPKNRRR